MKTGVGYIEEFYQLCTVTKINFTWNSSDCKIEQVNTGFSFSFA